MVTIPPAVWQEVVIEGEGADVPSSKLIPDLGTRHPCRSTLDTAIVIRSVEVMSPSRIWTGTRSPSVASAAREWSRLLVWLNPRFEPRPARRHSK